MPMAIFQRFKHVYVNKMVTNQVQTLCSEMISFVLS